MRKLWLCLLLTVATTFASAQLHRVGPLDPNNKFPQWYQDKSGLVLDLCLPNAQEITDGTCLLFAADIPNANAPLDFPTNFPEEAFYWNTTGVMDVNGGRATMVLGLEAAFAVGAPNPGDQIVFARVRFVIDAPSAGVYTVTYPYGTETFEVTAPGKRAIFFTRDIGVAPGEFAAAMNGDIAPFLRASATEGGAPLPPVVLPGGNTFLTDPNVNTFITGSPFGTNFFRIDGPDIGGPGVNTITLNQFGLLGRLHNGSIPSELKIPRATYSRDSNGVQVNVFADATAAIGVPNPQLGFAGTGIPAELMSASGLGRYYGSSYRAGSDALPPSQITVSNYSDTPVSSVSSAVTDEVTISQATFDPSSHTLRVKAASSDKKGAPRLMLVEYGAECDINGDATVSNLLNPPATVTIKSSLGGSDTEIVSIGNIAVAGPVAQDDMATVDADGSATIDVLANDTSATGLHFHLLGSPFHGTITVDASGLPIYKPAAAYAGTDSFDYYVTDDAGNGSNVATVSVTVKFTNHPPVAVNDSVVTVVNTPVAINVLNNDTDPDGNGTIDKTSVVITSAPASGVATVDAATGTIMYTPAADAAIGTVTFQYSIMDEHGLAAAAPATVSVNLVNPDSITVTKAEWRPGTRQWTIGGTTSIFGPGNDIIVHIGPTIAGPVLIVTPVDVVGGWKWVVKGWPTGPDATNTISVESTKGGKREGIVLKIN